MALDKLSDQFLLDSYSGQGGYTTGAYLVRHKRESDEDYLKRQQLSVYPNFVRKIIDVYTGFLWASPPLRETDDLYSKFSKNADGIDTRLDSLLESYQKLAMILGTVYVIVDRSMTEATSRADQTMPYLAIRQPCELVSEEKYSNGRWKEVTFSEWLDKKIVNRRFTETGWQLLDSDDAVIDEGSHTLGRVPVVPLHVAKPLNPTDSKSQSFSYDLAVLNWELFNARSEMRDLFRAQTFSILTLPAVDSAEREHLKDLTIGTENGLTYNPNGGGIPAFISPSPDPINLYMQHISNAVDDIYKVSNLEFVGGVQQSGVALSFHFRECNSSLRSMAKMCETAENEIASLVYRWMGQEFTGNIAYNDDFNLADVAQDIANTMNSITLGLGAEFDKAIKKNIAKKVLGNEVSHRTMQDIADEIDAEGDVYGNRIAMDSGNSAMGIASDIPEPLPTEQANNVDLSGIESQLNAIQSTLNAPLQTAPVINVTIPEQQPSSINVAAPIVNVTNNEPDKNQPAVGKLITLTRDSNGVLTEATVGNKQVIFNRDDSGKLTGAAVN